MANVTSDEAQRADVKGVDISILLYVMLMNACEKPTCNDDFDACADEEQAQDLKTQMNRRTQCTRGSPCVRLDPEIWFLSLSVM